jgi:hypothetical protein
VARAWKCECGNVLGVVVRELQGRRGCLVVPAVRLGREPSEAQQAAALVGDRVELRGDGLVKCGACQRVRRWPGYKAETALRLKTRKGEP